MNDDLIVTLGIVIWCALLLLGIRAWDVQSRWATHRAENRIRTRRGQQPRYSRTGRRPLAS